MSYSYQTQRANLFTEEGQWLFTKWRDRAKDLLSLAGAFTHGRVGLPPGIGAADGRDLLACADRMVELGELRELTGPEVWGQDRVFVKGPKL